MFMESRREFIKKASLLASGASLLGMLPPSIQKALAINPAEGSTYLDAEHIVILMQENRSFDHCYGSLQGVRGFNDPRALRLSNRNKVWLQTNAKGETYTPFRLNLKDTKATWMSSLPHSWENQVDARNDGKYDQWLEAKKPDAWKYRNIPMTLGFYNREDIPFYYAMADAFTVCDQNFCSSLTGTTPNRLYFWTGTIREKADFESKANVKNEDVTYNQWASWKTFPERLEEMGIAWKIYQNEISLESGLSPEEDAWLSSFTDNPIEWFEQYQVKFAPEYRQYLQKLLDTLPNEIAQLQTQLKNLAADSEEAQKTKKLLSKKERWLKIAQKEAPIYTEENFKKLSAFEKNIHQKAFTNNRNDPHYRNVTKFPYDDRGETREITLPKGDILHQFRTDVKNKQLPAVSWLVAPENFSDHPSAPWYGAWYVSEVIDILTQNPAIWQKTIFILAYDENDGYFDHVPPFVAPNPIDALSGKVSAGIDTAIEQVNLKHERKRDYDNPDKEARQGPIGLGYRVPLLIASPWTRGGRVCSQVFDHTSVLQFLETFLRNKTQKDLKESNISEWRRTICGDLSSVFQPYQGEKIQLPTFVAKEPFIKQVHQAQFKEMPSNFKALSTDEIKQINQTPWLSPWMPRQEKGIRTACALPYELYVDGKLSANRKTFELAFEAANTIFKDKAQGAPFTVYERDRAFELNENERLKTRNYAVKSGDRLTDAWQLNDFLEEKYCLEVFGPNGFYRLFKGDDERILSVTCRYQTGDNNTLTGNVILTLENLTKKPLQVKVQDKSYLQGTQTLEVAPKNYKTVVWDLTKSHNWYDLQINVWNYPFFEERYAGHIETGKDSFTDPAMGGIIES